MNKIFSKNEISAVAGEILEKLKAKNAQHEASVVALSGDLGAGKTTLTQAIAAHVGVKENVVSPTFVIMKIYELEGAAWKHLIHIDAYRLDSDDELLKLGWNDLVADPSNLILIEWPERVAGIIPKNASRVELSHENEEDRRITVS